MKIKKLAIKFIVKTLMTFAVFGAFAVSVSAAEINGYYEGDDGGAYFIRQIGNKIYWFGEDPKGGFANVLAGAVSGNKITAKFWDVPKGKTKGAGEITLEIQAGGLALTKLSSTVPFGMKTLKKFVPKNDFINGVPFIRTLPPEMRSRPEGFSGGESNLTGAWTGDDYATYYIREMPSKDVVFFAENNLWGGQGGYAQPAFARVFIGKKVGSGIVGEWVDLPKGKANGNNSLTLGVKSPQDITLTSAGEGNDASRLWRSLPNSLRGYADLHTHPMVNLGFGGKLIHGGADVGSLLPADSDCNPNVRAKNIGQALGDDKSTHGGFGLFDNKCGDSLRATFIDIFQDAKKALVTPDHALGYPSFSGYPKWNDVSHQKMWVDWIRRSYDAGQRVMVALATHNATLAAVASGPGDGPNDDVASADLQVKEIKALVGRHSDFMEVAYTPADVRRIVAANKMAVVLGVEIDNIGNFNKFPGKVVPPAAVIAEIKRLHSQGVRYAFPVHVLDNAFGSTAVYEDLFNYSNKREQGSWYDIKCAAKADDIKYKFNPLLSDQSKEVKDLLGGLAGMVKVSLDLNAPKPPACDGHMNKDGLSDLGRDVAIPAMMKLGMLIDVDHMSQLSVKDTLDIAEKVPGGYPLVSGHTGLRPYQHTENARTQEQLERIGKLGGMFGLGSEDVLANNWAAQYAIANDWITGEGRVALGTDLNGLVKGAPPRKAANIYQNGLTKSKTGDKTWDYRTDGVAHYGMLADFLADVRTEPNHGAKVNINLFKNAEMFAQMWEKAVKNGKGA